MSFKHTHTHILLSFLSLSFSLFGHGAFSVYTALTSRERADYYSVAIKSQFGLGRLSGHLKGHSTRQIIGSIEMDGAVKVEPASLVWKCACKNLGVATNLNHRPLQNIDARMSISPWGFTQQRWIRGWTPASEIYFVYMMTRSTPQWTGNLSFSQCALFWQPRLLMCVFKACAYAEEFNFMRRMQSFSVHASTVWKSTFRHFNIAAITAAI